MTHAFPARRSSDLVIRQLVPLEPADAVLGADRSVEPDDDVVHRAVHLRPARHEGFGVRADRLADRSEEHTSELQSLMRNSYAVFCLKKKTHIVQRCQHPTVTR